MSHRGNKPSTGCQRCRSRKVKCDETRPVCQRCTRSGFECVYRDSFDMLLRDQTRDAEQRANQKWRARAQTSGQTSRSRSSEGASKSRRESTRPVYTTDSAIYLRCSSPLLVPIEELAINRFFYDFVIFPPQDSPYSLKGYMPFLPDMYFGCSTASALSSTVMAISLANFAGRVRSSKIESNGRQEYVEALKLTKEALADPDESKSDETLLSIYLLAMYELIQYPKHNRGSWSVHLDGAIALVRMHADRQSPTQLSPTGAWICRLVTWQMLIKYLRDGLHPPGDRAEWLARWRDLGLPEARLADLQFRAADLSALLRHPLPADVESWEVHQQCENLNFAFDTWEADFRLYSPYQTLPSESDPCPRGLAELLDAEGKPPVAHRYQRLFMIVIWNFYRSTRLRVELARTYHPALYTSDAERAAALNRMVALIEDICASVYSSFTVPIEGKPVAEDVRDVCGVRSYALLYPLSLAAKCLRETLAEVPGMADRLAWVQVVLEHMQHDFSVSGSMECGTFKTWSL